jgi:hypothetical protein
MSTLIPNLSILPPAQRALWAELDVVPSQFTLYGGTALALRLGHRTSVDFDFFSKEPFDPDQLASTLPFLQTAERVQVAVNTLTCRVDRGAAVLVSFFGGLDLGQAGPADVAEGVGLSVASLLDLAATKVAVVQKRAEAKDYVDVDALMRSGIDLIAALAAARVVYGPQFNPLITLKALSYFDDLPTLPQDVRQRLGAAIDAIDTASLSMPDYRERRGTS